MYYVQAIDFIKCSHKNVYRLNFLYVSGSRVMVPCIILTTKNLAIAQLQTRSGMKDNLTPPLNNVHMT